MPSCPDVQPIRLLFSYWYFRDYDLDAWFDRHLDAAYPADTFADSGGFTAHTKGVSIEVADYAAWINRWRHRLDVVATLDVIGDAEATARNTAELRALTDVPIIPAFHVNEPWSALWRMLEDGERYIALGGMVGKPVSALIPWASHAMRLAGDAAAFHGFGLTSNRALDALPWYSVDSSAWITTFQRGKLTLHDEAGRIVTTPVVVPRASRSIRDARAIWPAATRPAVTSLLRRRGIDPTVLLDPEHFSVEHFDGDRQRGDSYPEYATLVGVVVDDWQRYERLLRARWGERRVPGPSDQPAGLRLFLVAHQGTYYMTARSGAFVDHPAYPGPSTLARYAAAH